MNGDWLRKLFDFPDLLGMGHHQRAEDCNLGLGWLYYALARILRPRTAVCIGSWRGFVPIVLAKALKDNAEGGRVIFIDPSLVDDFWKDAGRTQSWFKQFNAGNIEHHCVTTQEFAASDAFQSLDSVGLLFVDGYHTAEQARFDHETFEPLLSDDAMVLFHDSVRVKESRIYGSDRPYEHSVVRYMDALKTRQDLQIMDFAHGSGVTLVRRNRQVPPAK
jgi:predicted O-methyltransferase YrrM